MYYNFHYNQEFGPTKEWSIKHFCSGQFTFNNYINIKVQFI